VVITCELNSGCILFEFRPKWISWDDISVTSVFHKDIVFVNFYPACRWFLPLNFLANIAYVFIVFAILATCSVHIFVELIIFIQNYIYQYMGLFSFVVTLFLLRSNNLFTNRQTDH
jgi:hypothetical protein